MFRLLGLAACAIVLAGCETYTQTTSGADYLARYEAMTTTPSSGEASKFQTVDDDVRTIAAVEPNLRFPARIGVARIENGQLSAVPPAELVHWGALVDTLGDDFGEFVPVSPLVAAMVDTAPQTRRYTRRSPGEVMAHIRRGAARQHLDYVLVYELSGGFDRRTNLLSAADLTILGYYLLPSTEVEIRGAANALLLDVRNGYPYGTAAVTVEDSDLGRAPTARERGQAGVDRAKIQAVAELTGEIEIMVRDLQRALPAADEAAATSAR